MASGFKFDERAFKKAVAKGVNAAVKDAAADGQRMFDALHRSHSGKPASEVLPHVRSALRRAGWKASEREIKDYAELISRGNRVVLKPQPLR